MEFKQVSEEKLDIVASELINLTANNSVIILDGDLGAGKTTFVKRVVAKLGIESLVTSPTFAIMNKYSNDHQVIVHIDAYRVSGDDYETEDMLLEQMEQANYSFVEWASNIENVIAEFSNVYKVTIEINLDDTRDIKIEKVRGE